MSEYITTVTGNHAVITLPPASPSAPEVSWLITKFAFKKRMPAEKWRAARAAAEVDPMLADFFEDFDLAKHMDLQYPQTVAAINALMSPSVPAEFRLTQGEVDAVLAIPCQPGEEP